MKASLAVISLIWVILLGPASYAATCPESVPAPKYQVGDRFTWKYTNGKEKVWEVTGFDGNLAQVKWSDGDTFWASENEGTYFLDQDWVIRKGINKKGDILLSPRVGAFSMIGIKDLDFPLNRGKGWSFILQSRDRYGSVNTFNTTLTVVGCDEVATLAGRFLALKIEAVETPRLWSGWGTIRRWYSPDAKNIVKVEFGPWFGGSTGSGPGPTLGMWSTRPDNYELMKLELR